MQQVSGCIWNPSKCFVAPVPPWEIGGIQFLTTNLWSTLAVCHFLLLCSGEVLSCPYSTLGVSLACTGGAFFPESSVFKEENDFMPTSLSLEVCYDFKDNLPSELKYIY
jgi:hypothetical protein